MGCCSSTSTTNPMTVSWCSPSRTRGRPPLPPRGSSSRPTMPSRNTRRRNLGADAAPGPEVAAAHDNSAVVSRFRGKGGEQMRHKVVPLPVAVGRRRSASWSHHWMRASSGSASTFDGVDPRHERDQRWRVAPATPGSHAGPAPGDADLPRGSGKSSVALAGLAPAMRHPAGGPAADRADESGHPPLRTAGGGSGTGSACRGDTARRRGASMLRSG
jgi:hypothetical protein